MKLKPRQIALLVLVIAVAVYRYTHRRVPQVAAVNPPVVAAPQGPRPESDAWKVYDHTIELKDAPAAAFDPAFQQLKTQLQATPDADVSACTTWLEFYRQSALHPSQDTKWHDDSARHITNCNLQHRDTTR